MFGRIVVPLMAHFPQVTRDNWREIPMAEVNAMLDYIYRGDDGGQ